MIPYRDLLHDSDPLAGAPPGIKPAPGRFPRDDPGPQAALKARGPPFVGWGFDAPAAALYPRRLSVILLSLIHI